MIRTSAPQVFALVLICALAKACSLAPHSSSPSQASTSLASQDFAKKFCDQIVDPLQQGSFHWMACNSETKKLLKQGTTPENLVLVTCQALQDLFVSPENLSKCLQGGKKLIASESFGQVQKDMFERTARSLVACYEKVGTIQPSYDEEGRCDEDSGLSAWTMTTERRTDPSLESFEALDSRNPSVGRYAGQVLFYNEVGRTCTFALDFTYSGEDVTVETQNFDCR